MEKLIKSDFLNEFSDVEFIDPDIVKEYITTYLEDLGFNVLDKSESPNERFLNQDDVVIGYNTTEWFGYVKTEPEYEDSYSEYVTVWEIEGNKYYITEFRDGFGNKCFRVE